MIENNYIGLGKRAVVCKGWRWMPGMRWWTEDDRGRLDDYQPEYMGRPHDALPDLTDPATLGCVLALVREAWGNDFEQVWLEWYPPLRRWGILGGHAAARPILVASGSTEAEALVAALEAAP
jgi:hypothetical protein